MFIEEIKLLKDKAFRLEEKIKFLEEVEYCLRYAGLTGVVHGDASLEDWRGFDFDLYEKEVGYPLQLKWDRRWIGFPELSEYDHMKDKILPQFYDFKR
jgi:hypothetical protein